MSVNIVVVKMLGKAGVVFTRCLVEKCVVLLSSGMWFVILLSFQLYTKWYLVLALWRGR